MNVQLYFHSSFDVKHVVCFMYEQISFVYIVHVIFVVLLVVHLLMKTFYIILFAQTNFLCLYYSCQNKFFMLNTFTILYVFQVYERDFFCQLYSSINLTYSLHYFSSIGWMVLYSSLGKTFPAFTRPKIGLFGWSHSTMDFKYFYEHIFSHPLVR